MYSPRTYYLLSLIGRYILVEIGSSVTKSLHRGTMFPGLYAPICLMIRLFSLLTYMVAESGLVTGEPISTKI